MGIQVQFERLCRVQIRRLVMVIGIMVAVIVVVQLTALPYDNYILILAHARKASNSLELTNTSSVHGVVISINASNLDEAGYKSESEEEEEKDYDFTSDDDEDMDNFVEVEKDINSHNKFKTKMNLSLDQSSTMRHVRSTDKSSTKEKEIQFKPAYIEQIMILDQNSIREYDIKTSNTSTKLGLRNETVTGFAELKSARTFTSGMEYLDEDSGNISSLGGDKQGTRTQHKNLEQIIGNTVKKNRGMKPMSISQMTALWLQNSVSANTMRPCWSSARCRELQHARLQIENAPIIRNPIELDASVFRNVSLFRRSYELMERMLKVYIYKEGEKPIFHQPKLRGIYASEGWFMNLMEKNKRFVVRDPKKAHLFYLPFSSQKLRSSLHESNSTSHRDLESYLKNYTDRIAKRYLYWNRASGADHFLVACHDWAPKFTRNHMGNCIRALCNSNVARGFRIGKDVSLAVTFVRTAQDPLKDLGGNPPSERPNLAFFAGSMHGHLRPILLQYWNNKESDMKIFGPMPRDIEGKTRYRGLMKSSKYCICAKGYEVHTPRVVESIYYECVPVIISDNYVPPFLEVLDWESFSVFILEEDVPNLRDILVSIPEEKYLAMQHRVKMVQRHFLWYKNPVKYDLFHMILHSIWHSRVFQLTPR